MCPTRNAPSFEQVEELEGAAQQGLSGLIFALNVEDDDFRAGQRLEAQQVQDTLRLSQETASLYSVKRGELAMAEEQQLEAAIAASKVWIHEADDL